MDRFQAASEILKEYYSFKQTGNAPVFIEKLCKYFDDIHEAKLSDADKSFLLFLCNKAGIPQYYRMLTQKEGQHINEENMSLPVLSALINEASLTEDGLLLHKYQKEISDRFALDKQNRYILTAPTSFGKTFIVYRIIKKMNYKCIALIFPSISLLSENYRRICDDKFFTKYKKHTLSDARFNPEEYNIFIYTPERYLSFLDANPDMKFDFAFIDEIYKIDGTLNYDEIQETEEDRDMAYRLSLDYLSKSSSDILLAGPYMELTDKLNQNDSFERFAEARNIKYLIYNDYKIVNQDFKQIKTKKQYCVNNHIIHNNNPSHYGKISNILMALTYSEANTLIYCGRKTEIKTYVDKLLKNKELISILQSRCHHAEGSVYDIFIQHLEHVFSTDWIVVKALKCGIGIHHGLIPKYIQNEIIDLFNKGDIICLFSTTTITEGVNTSAKNIIITSIKKGERKLLPFDAMNIAGRAGRFMHHYSGEVLDLTSHFDELLEGETEVLKHKNYDKNAKKTEIDYQITDDIYLSENELENKVKLEERIKQSNIPLDYLEQCKLVSISDKLDLYDSISKLEDLDNDKIRKFIKDLNKSRGFNMNAFEIIIKLLIPYIKEPQLKQLCSSKYSKNPNHSVCTTLVWKYIRNGYLGMLKFDSKNNKNYDEVVNNTSKIVFRCFKYQLVKYLSVFDILWRYNQSVLTHIPYDAVEGFGSLLAKLEHSAITPRGRLVSDFGVPFSITEKYDKETKTIDKSKFDPYEMYIDEKLSKYLQL